MDVVVIIEYTKALYAEAYNSIFFEKMLALAAPLFFWSTAITFKNRYYKSNAFIWYEEPEGGENLKE